MSIKEITNSEDIIDSRDVIARIEHLEDERAALVEDADASRARGEDSDAMLADIEAIDDELKPLKALAEEAEAAADWQYGAALIRDSYFETYARDLAEDIGAIKSDLGWPYDYIDWERAADALKQDYTSVDFDGVTYRVRA